MTTNPEKKIDFAKVEALRRHMLLTHNDMAKVFRVTRQSWYLWLNNRAYPKNNKEAEVRAMIRKLLSVMAEHQWPAPDVIASSQRERFEKLLALLR